MKEMLREAEYELLHYPQRTFGYYLKRTVRRLLGRKVEPLDPINWPNGLLTIGLMDYYKRHRNSEEARQIQDCLKSTMTAGSGKAANCFLWMTRSAGWR